MGFKFSIKHPKTEEEYETDDEPGGQKKDLKENKQHLDAGQQKDNEQNDERQEVRPGQPIVIPSKVSSCCCYFRYGSAIYYTVRVYVDG